MKYKVIKEYPRFYLCESEKGYRETFSKALYKPNDGIIYVKHLSYEREGLDPEKVNRDFNPNFSIKR